VATKTKNEEPARRRRYEKTGWRPSVIPFFEKLLSFLRRSEMPPVPGSGELRAENLAPEASRSARKLEECFGAWKTQPALLLDTSGAGIAAVVWCRGIKFDEWGYRLVIEIEEPLIVPEGLAKNATVELSASWGYGSFGPEHAGAPYLFHIYFGEPGVKRIRRLWAMLPPGKEQRPVPPALLATLQRCVRGGWPPGASEEQILRSLAAQFGGKPAGGEGDSG